MKKRFLAIAIAAGLASPFAANADASLFGTLHVSLHQVDTDATTDAYDGEMDFGSHKSNFGFKGSEDLGDGMKAIYLAQWQVDTVTDGAQGDLAAYDRYVGLKGGFGTVKIGTMASNYKQTGSKVDPLWGTGFEMRATGLASSALYNGTGVDRGRLSDAIQYSNEMGAIGVVFNMTMDGTGDNNMGLGLRYNTKALTAYFDFISVDSVSSKCGATKDQPCTIAGESGMKVGLNYTMGATTVGIAQEMVEDVDGADYMQFFATQKLNDNDTVALTYGAKSATGDDRTGTTLAYIHSLSKRTSTYAAFTSQSNDIAASEASGFALGLKHKF